MGTHRKRFATGSAPQGFSVWRQGRALFYREKGAGSSKKKATMIYILKKSVTIPKREFFTLSSGEIDVILDMVRGKQ
jgi:hypothetical protein